MKNWIKDIFSFYRNVRKFRKELWRFRDWDYSYNLALFRRSLELTAAGIERYGNEEPVMRGKRIKAMRRVIELLNDDKDYIKLAEKQTGVMTSATWEFYGFPSEIDKTIFARAQEIEKADWRELWDIVHGMEGYPGSDIRGWWD